MFGRIENTNILLQDLFLMQWSIGKLLIIKFYLIQTIRIIVFSLKQTQTQKHRGREKEREIERGNSRHTKYFPYNLINI